MVSSKTMSATTPETTDGITDYRLDFPKEKIQYIKVVVENYGQLPLWHNLKGKQAYIFIDEIIIE